jgi:hypothetical protein
VLQAEEALASQDGFGHCRDTERLVVPAARREAVEGVSEELVVDHERLETRCRGLHGAATRQKPGTRE